MNDQDEALARNRYMIIQMLRIFGVGLTIVGILIVRGKIDLDPIVGYALIVVGLLDAFGTPLVLARKWRTPPE
jgi:hypothetical protein